MNTLSASNKVMSLYRYELQYHDMKPTQIAPGKIRQYPQNLAMQSVVGRNLANTAWDILAAKQQQGHVAMQRDEQIRALSIETGVSEVHLHSSVPHGHQNVFFERAMGLPGVPPPAAPAAPPGAAEATAVRESGVDAPAPVENPFADATQGFPSAPHSDSNYSSVSSAMNSVRSRNSGHSSVTRAEIQARQD